MPNGNDPVLDEMRQVFKGGGTGAAVAEPEEKDSVLDEMRQVFKGAGTPATPGQRAKGPQATRPMIAPEELEPQLKGPVDLPEFHFDDPTGDFISTAPDHHILTDKEIDEAQAREDKRGVFAQERAKPFETQPTTGGKLTDQASRLGELPLELPGQPHAVRGQFDQPTPPTLPPHPPPDLRQPLDSERPTIRSEQGVAEYLDNLYSRLRDATSPRRFDKSGKALPNIEESPLGVGILAGVPGGALKLASGAARAFGSARPTPFTEAQFGGTPSSAEDPKEAERRLRETTEATRGFNDAIRGGFQTLAPLAILDPAAIAAMPMYGEAADAGQKALVKAGMKPETAEAITNLALVAGPAVLHATRINESANSVRDMAVAIGHTATDGALKEYPNFVNMTPESQKTVLNEMEQRVWQNLVNSNKVAVAKFATKMGLDPAELYDFVKPEDAEEPPAEAQKALPAVGGTKPEPEPPAKEETPPEAQETPQPATPERKVAPPEAPPEEKTAVALENAVQEIRASAAPPPREELPTEPPEREVMVRPEEPSRAAPTGEEAALPRELKADLEEQAGRPPSDEEAVAMDRSNLERGMAEGERPELPTEAPQSEIRPSEEITPAEPTTSKGEPAEQLETRTEPSDQWDKMEPVQRVALIKSLGASGTGTFNPRLAARVAARSWDELKPTMQQALSDQLTAPSQAGEPEPTPEAEQEPAPPEEPPATEQPVPRTEQTGLTQEDYDQLEKQVLAGGYGRPEHFPSYEQLRDERAKAGLDSDETLQQTAQRLTKENLRKALEGPGTPSVGQFDPTKSSMDELTDSIRRVVTSKEKLSDRLRRALDISHTAARTRDAVSGALGNVKAAAVAISDMLARPREWTGFKDALGDYQGGVQKSASEIRNFAKQIKRRIPNVDTRNAMAAFLEADGDKDTLRNWASKSKGEATDVYENALKLTNEEKTAARNIQQFQDERGQLAVDQGIMDHMVENYVMHVWKKENTFTRGAVNLMRTRMLQRNPSFARKRVFPTVFDGEQAGFTPESRDLGALTAARQYAQNEATLARALIRSLLDGKQKDGRPTAAVSGSGSAIPESSINKNAYFITATAKPEEIADFRFIDHPALREWKWATKDSDGNPIFVKGNIVVHPDVYRHLNNVLSKSAISSYTIPRTQIQPGRAFLRAGSEFKNTLLSLSGFHQTQESVHALEHRVNPSRLTDIDFNDKEQWQLIKHGLMVSSNDGQEQFSEGLSASGLVNRIPGIGPFLQTYQDYLFQDYIPRLKITMALHALGRNRERYHDLSEDQLYELTANQANAAFGEQNLTMMGRNKTFQDVLRLALLAPDFFESRARFVGQALKPYGREQLVALALGAAVLYAGARIMNQLLDNDPHWDPQDAFSIVYHGKSYSLRTVQADVAHLVTDPRGFVYNRLNPLTARTAIEAITGRDKYGRKRSAGDQAKDLLNELVPIPAQGQLKSIPETPGETLLTSAGVSTYPYKTPAEHLAQQYAMDAIGTGDDRSPAQIKASRRLAQLVNNIRIGKQKPEALQDALDKKQISDSQFASATRQLGESPLISDTERLGPKQLLDVFDVASKAEREQLAPRLRSKAVSLDDVDAETRKELEPRMDTALKATGNEAFIPGAVDAELERLHYQGLRSVTAVEKELRYQGEKYPLGAKEQGEYQALRASKAREYLGDMFKDPRYAPLSDDEKLFEVKGQVKDADAWAAEEMMSRLEKRRLGKGDEIQDLPVGAPTAPPAPQGLPMEAPNVQ